MVIEIKNRPLDVAIVRFPGSNCDFDTLRFFEWDGHKPKFLWHTETKTPKADLMVLPGGFAFGDRVYARATGSFTIDPGVQALQSPVMDVVRQWAKDGRPILGICNGFQILIHAKLLPGELVRNESNQFFCDDVNCIVEGRSFFADQSLLGNTYLINVAHGFGRYKIDKENYEKFETGGQIFLRYHGFNPNGSFENIAGVSNKEGNIFGMMPHPERTDPDTRHTFLSAIKKYVNG